MIQRFWHRLAPRTAWLLGLAALLLAGAASADPPMRVARLGFVSGTVSFSPGGVDEWVLARVNRPVSGGDRLWVGENSRAELQLGSMAMRVASGSYLTVLALDDRIAQVHLGQGTLNLRVRRLHEGEVIEVSTPNLAFSVTRPGWYRIDVDDRGESTEVVVFDGAGDAFGYRSAYRIASGQGYRFYGTDLEDFDVVGRLVRDEFDNWAFARDRRWDASASRRYVSVDVIGFEDLDQYGTWRTVGDFGGVWFPTRVESGWAPYRNGHWSWVDPWGWTWVDEAPWGFAPFHYGRWARFDGRWGWVPGPRDVRPVYAPALVAFVGGDNFRLSVSAGAGPAIGWFPLAPGEVYRPSYTVSREYFTRVNVTNTVINQTIVNNHYSNVDARINYRLRNDPAAVTVVPAQAFVQARPVGRAAISLNTQQISQALAQAPVTAVAPVAPRMESMTGGAQAAPAAPPARLVQRQVIVKTEPPPPPVAFQQRQQTLEAQPGKPLTTEQLRAERREARGEARKGQAQGEQARQPEQQREARGAAKGEPAGTPGAPRVAQPTSQQGAGGAPNVTVVQPAATPQPITEAVKGQAERRAREAGRTPETAKGREVEKGPETAKGRETEKAPETAKGREAEKAPETAKGREAEKGPETAKGRDPGKGPETAKGREAEKGTDTAKGRAEPPVRAREEVAGPRDVPGKGRDESARARDEAPGKGRDESTRGPDRQPRESAKGSSGPTPPAVSGAPPSAPPRATAAPPAPPSAAAPAQAPPMAAPPATAPQAGGPPQRSAPTEAARPDAEKGKGTDQRADKGPDRDERGRGRPERADKGGADRGAAVPPAVTVQPPQSAPPSRAAERAPSPPAVTVQPPQPAPPSRAAERGPSPPAPTPQAIAPPQPVPPAPAAAPATPPPRPAAPPQPAPESRAQAAPPSAPAAAAPQPPSPPPSAQQAEPREAREKGKGRGRDDKKDDEDAKK